MTRFTVQKYIDEKVLAGFSGMQKGDIHIFNAPTGSGKTEFAKTSLPALGKKVIIAVPTKTIGFNKMTDTIPFYYGKNPLPHNLPGVCFCTYDQLVKDIDFEDVIVVFDEAHRLATDGYRMEVFAKVLERVTTKAFATIFMSATMEKQVWEQVFPNAKHITVKAIERQSHTISFYDAPLIDDFGNETDAKSPAPVVSDLIRNYAKTYIIVAFIQSRGELKRLAESFKYLNPMILDSDEGKATYYHDNEVKHFLKTGELPKECGLVLATSFAWEGYDIARHDKPFLFINGLTNVTDNKLPAVWSQMMARARIQDEVTMIIAGDSKPKPFDMVWEPSVKDLDEATLSAYNKKETNPNKYSMLYNEKAKQPTLIAKLQYAQKSFNTVATRTVLSEMEKYNLKLGGEAHKKDYLQYEKNSITSVKYEVVKILLNHPHISHKKKRGRDSAIENLIQQKKSATTGKGYSKNIYAILTGFKLVQEKAYETFLASSHIHLNSWSDVKDPAKAYSKIQWLYDRKELAVLRRVVWERWEGKEFTQKEFARWTQTKEFIQFYRREPALKSYWKDLLSKQAMGKGIIGKLFTVRKSRANKNHPWKYSLSNEIPFVNNAYAYEWSHHVYALRHKKRLKEIGKESQHRNRNIEMENKKYTLQGATILKSVGIDFDIVA